MELTDNNIGYYYVPNTEDLHIGFIFYEANLYGIYKQKVIKSASVLTRLIKEIKEFRDEPFTEQPIIAKKRNKCLLTVIV